MTPPPIAAVLLDVGGTLWPDGWPWLPNDQQARTSRLREALPELDLGTATALLRDLDSSAAGIAELLEQDLGGYVGELLAVRRAGLRSVVLSNSYWRSNAAYQRDFQELGVDGGVDAYLSSLDVGFRKPHPAIFEAGLQAAGVAAERCAMVGNSEDKDVRPARALGMRVIRVAIEEPVPASSQADAVTDSLHEVARLLTSWSAAGP